MTKSTQKKPAGKAEPRSGGARERIVDLLYQALETELGGVEIYRTALKCVQNDELRKEWEEYLEQTETHVTTMRGVCDSLGLDPDRETPGRQVVRHIGKSLVKAMHMALGADDPSAAERVAAECVVLAETKDHTNWTLIGMLAKQLSGKEAGVLQDAYDATEDEEDEHLYHTTGWARELWVEALGLPAVLPPPEETQDVKSAVAAARAKHSRTAEAE